MAEAERELRIAPVMTGGTSLAVWMGGATAELYRVLRAPIETGNDDEGLGIYRKLLELTSTRPIVDVITGTSAGGLNGALLAAGWRLGVAIESFMAIRETWLDVADIEKLLRRRTETNPPSLLNGDSYFAPQVAATLNRFREQSVAASDGTTGDRPDVDLVTTVTTITPVPRTRFDHFGEAVHEVDHAQTLRFRATQLGDDKESKSADEEWIQKVAIAARTSASIPGVFEPSYLAVGEDDAIGAKRPNFGPHASFGQSRWGVDGGVVVNLPLTEALDRIYERRARGEVRRIALYISPTPASQREPVSDQIDVVPTLRQAVSTIVAAPRAEGISSDIDRLSEQNVRTERQAMARAVLGQLSAELTVTGPVFAEYRRQRAVASIEHMVREVWSGISDQSTLDRAATAASFMEARLALMPERVNELDGPGEPRRRWGWGIEPVDQAVSSALALVARTLSLISRDDETRPALLVLKDKLHQIRDRIAAVRELDDHFWPRRFASVTASTDLSSKAAEWYRQWPYADDDDLKVGVELFGAVGATEAAAAATSAIVAPDRPAADGETDPPIEVARQAVFEVLRGGHFHTARVLHDERTNLRAAVASAQTRTAGTPRHDEAVTLAHELEALLGREQSPRGVRDRLLKIHVLQVLTLGDLVQREQRVELMQLSFNAFNGLDARAPQEKLAGPELARLGAFLKASWRANDWFWGRMDAAHRLVLLLLEPRELIRCNRAADLREWIGGLVDPDGSEPVVPTAVALAAAQAELDGLIAGEDLRTLPRTAQFVATHLQLAIARAELPYVADAIDTSAARGANDPDGGAFLAAVRDAQRRSTDATATAPAPVPPTTWRRFVEWIRGTPPPPKPQAKPLGPQVPNSEVRDLVRQLGIGRETLGTEFGHGLVNRVLARSGSVAVNALTGGSAGLPGVGRILSPLRAPLHAAASVVERITATDPLSRAIGAFLMAISASVLAIRLVGGDVPSAMVAVAIILVTGVFVNALLRSRFWWLSLTFSAAALVVALTLVGPDLADVVYDQPGTTAVAKVPAEATIELDGAGTVRVTSGGGSASRVNDVEVVAGSTVELRGTDATVTQPTSVRPQAWKQWGFTTYPDLELVSAFNVFVLILGLLAVVRSRSGADVLGRLAITAGVILGSPWVFEKVLTGREPDPGAAGNVKDWLVDAADTLHDYDLAVVMAVLVGTTVLLALGTDVAIARVLRRRRNPAS